MDNYPITRARIDELLRFLPLFDVPGREFIERWGGGEEVDNGSMTFPYPVYCSDVEEFVNCAGDECWRDYNYHQ